MKYNFRIMVKVLTLFALFIVIAGVVVLVTCKYQAPCQEEKLQTDKEPPSTLVESNPKAKGTESQDKSTQSKECAPCRYKLLAWPEGIGAWALLATLIVIGWQSFETSQSVRAAKEAAKAALLQAKHVEASERARLSISSANEKESVLRPGAPPMYLWKIRNVGRTPARLIETQAVCQITESVKLPPDPVFPPKSVPLGGRILGPDESLDFHAFWTDERGILFREAVETLNPVWLTAYGFVKYMTVFDAEVRESRFCDDFIDGSDTPVRGENPTRIIFRPYLDAPDAYTKST